MEDNLDYINMEAAERARKSTFERTNEFLVKLGLLKHLPPHERFDVMLKIFNELLIRITKAELRINELEEKLK